MANNTFTNAIHTNRIFAILLLAAGYGWAGGHFIPASAPVWAYGFQFFMLLFLIVFGTGFLKDAGGHHDGTGQQDKTALVDAGDRLDSTDRGERSPGAKRNIRALTVFAILTLLINIVNIIRGAADNGPYGSHNNFADLVPIMLIMVGDILWLMSLANSRSRLSR